MSDIIAVTTEAGNIIKVISQGPQGPAGPLNAPVVLLASDGTPGTAPLKFVAGTKLAVPEPGAMEYTGTHILFTTDGGQQHSIITANGVKIANTTVANTTVETEIYSRVFPAGELHQDQIILFTLMGAYSSASGSDAFTIRIKVNGNIAQSFVSASGNVVDAGMELLFNSTIRTDGPTGTYVSFAKMTDNGTVQTAATSTPSVVDTTVDNTLSVTVQWGVAKAGNSVTASEAYVQFMH